MAEVDFKSSEWVIMSKPAPIKGFSKDDERLKNPPVADSIAPDYFNDMLARVRDIRASERRMYLRVREIFALAADYVPSLPETNKFFSVIQNKLHFTVTGMTAAEIIAARVNHTSPNAGLLSWARDPFQMPDSSGLKAGDLIAFLQKPPLFQQFPISDDYFAITLSACFITLNNSPSPPSELCSNRAYRVVTHTHWM